MSNKLLGYIKEKELTHDDVIAMIDENLQRVIETSDNDEPSSEEEKDIVETFNLGVAGYIFKPVDSKKLEEFKPIKLYWTVRQ